MANCIIDTPSGGPLLQIASHLRHPMMLLPSHAAVSRGQDAPQAQRRRGGDASRRRGAAASGLLGTGQQASGEDWRQVHRFCSTETPYCWPGLGLISRLTLMPTGCLSWSAWRPAVRACRTQWRAGASHTAVRPGGDIAVDSAVALLRTHPDLVVIGVDPSSEEMLVPTCRSRAVSSVTDLVEFIWQSACVSRYQCRRREGYLTLCRAWE